ncbi:MAG: GlsB/YeaQ/YmgE family stress response membrane protein [Clostridia bacterium]|nr:GlsB/YeaQ/YmgE family stress response membrane protein [Clostridia bacterium]
MNVVIWLVFGALAVWLASIIMGTDARMGAGGNILYGILGSVVGGFLASLLGLGSVTGFNLSSLLIAVAGACLCLLVVNMLGRARG